MDLWAVCHALNSRNRPKNKDMRVISDTYFVVVPQKRNFYNKQKVPQWILLSRFY